MFRLVAVCAESNMLAALRAAAERARSAGRPTHFEGFPAHEVRRRRDELRQALSEADSALFSMVNTDQEAQALRQLLEESLPAQALIFNCQPDLVPFVRFAGFSGRELEDAGQARLWAERLKAAGAPLPPLGHVILAALPRILPMLEGNPDLAPLRAYGQAAAYWLHAGDENLDALLQMMASGGPTGGEPAPKPFPSMALWHPDGPEPFLSLEAYTAWHRRHLEAQNGSLPYDERPRVGVLFFRQLVASGDCEAYREAARALERRGLAVIGGFAHLDNTPLVERFLRPADVELLLNLTGFNLVGSMGRPDPEAAQRLLESLGVPYLVASPLLFQTASEWAQDPLGLAPMQTALQIALPELDGGIETRVYAGRKQQERLEPLGEELELLARRVEAWIRLRRTPRAERRLAVTLFSFPPDKGSLGTAAYLDVFSSLHSLMTALKNAGYRVDVPASPQELLQAIAGGEASAAESAAVAGRLPVSRYRRLHPGLERVERVWGPAPGQIDTDGRALLIRGARFGNLFVGVQPSFGYEGDPLRLLLSPEASPSHSFYAYYLWLRHEFGAHALVHFGTHGAMEFMPGKQVGLSSRCSPSQLVGDLPHVYFYALNNPSEGTIAKRRGSAVLVSYLNPPLAGAGLYRQLADLRQALDEWREAPAGPRKRRLAESIPALARQARLEEGGGASPGDEEGFSAYCGRLLARLQEIEGRLIPVGLHVAGRPLSPDYRRAYAQTLALAGLAMGEEGILPKEAAEAVGRALADAGEEAARAAFAGLRPDGDRPAFERWLRQAALFLQRLDPGGEIPGLLQALDGAYIPSGPGGDPVRDPAALPSGRNMHALDPQRIPSPGARRAAKRAVAALLEAARSAQGEYPDSVAMVLWGIDNIKTHGEGLAQVLELLGVEVLPDPLGRLNRLRLVPLEELGRPRIDVVLTLSGIFRDIFPSAVELLDRAVRLAAEADEPLERNHVRRRSLALAEALSVPFQEAATRLFSNAAGMYGTGVNHLTETSEWTSRRELGEVFLSRKAHAFGQELSGERQEALFAKALEGVRVAFQNLDSAEIGLSDVDHYFEYLGGLSAAVEAAGGEAPEAFVLDPLDAGRPVRRLEDALELEARAKLLNPRWYEGLLQHGYQGVHEIASRMDHLFGWSATTGRTAAWVYEEAAGLFIGDPEMRRRLEAQNRAALGRLAGRLLEAAGRGFWTPDAATAAALEEVLSEIEDAQESVAAP